MSPLGNFAIENNIVRVEEAILNIPINCEEIKRKSWGNFLMILPLDL